MCVSGCHNNQMFSRICRAPIIFASLDNLGRAINDLSLRGKFKGKPHSLIYQLVRKTLFKVFAFILLRNRLFLKDEIHLTQIIDKVTPAFMKVPQHHWISFHNVWDYVLETNDFSQIFCPMWPFPQATAKSNTLRQQENKQRTIHVSFCAGRATSHW